MSEPLTPEQIDIMKDLDALVHRDRMIEARAIKDAIEQRTLAPEKRADYTSELEYQTAKREKEITEEVSKINLQTYLLDHEDDIAIGMNDFALLRTVFLYHIGREPIPDTYKG
jgi:hypothetical protein